MSNAAVVAGRSRAPGSRLGAHLGLWQALTAVPAVVGSFFLLLVLFVGLGAWESVVLVGWLAAAPLSVTRLGELVVVRWVCGFRRLSAAEWAAVGPAWQAATRAAGIDRDRVRLYVQRNAQVNAAAVGGRSVAVTSAALRENRAGQVSRTAMTAIFCHELGHHATRATQLTPAAVWLATPWRVAARLVWAVVTPLARRQPVRLVALLAPVCVAIAVANLIQLRLWLSAAMLVGTAAAAVLCPLAHAAISRRSEYAADRYAAACGYGLALAAVLRAHADPAQRTWVSRAMATHPSLERRIAALTATGS